MAKILYDFIDYLFTDLNFDFIDKIKVIEWITVVLTILIILSIILLLRFLIKLFSGAKNKGRNKWE